MSLRLLHCHGHQYNGVRFKRCELQIRLLGVGAGAERTVTWTRSTTVCHSQTVRKCSSTAPAGGWRNGNDTVGTLGTCNAANEDGNRERELEVLHAGLVCLALWNGVESGHDGRVGWGLSALAVLACVIPSARRRCKRE